MPTIWERPAREDLLRRFSRLNADRKPSWGKMSAGQMLRHCTAALDMLTGAIHVAPKRSPLRNPLLRYLVIHAMPWPKGAPTAPELIMPAYTGDWRADMADLERALAVVVEKGETGNFSEHPAFGKLSSKSLGVLIFRHLDHHLRQFVG